MPLQTKSILLYSDDNDVRNAVVETLKPVVKALVVAPTVNESVQRAEMQIFDCVLMRSTKPDIKNPRGLHAWVKRQKKWSHVPFVVLGADIESESIILEDRNVRILKDHKSGGALIKMLEGLFYQPSANTIDVNFINPFVNAAASVLEQMGGLTLTRETPFVKKVGMKAPIHADVTGLIAMNSDRYLGSMSISFEEKVILSAFGKMMGTPVEKINDDVKDSVAELTNIIFGKAKSELNGLGHSIAPAIPSVVTGKDHEIRHSVEGMCLAIPFSVAQGRVLIECVIRQTNKS